MGTKRNTRRVLVAGIMVAGLTGGAMAVRADTFSQRSSTGQTQDLSQVAAPTWPSVAPTCSSSPCSISLHAGIGSVDVADTTGSVADSTPTGHHETVTFWGFGVNSTSFGLAGAPTSIIKVPQGTVLDITVHQAAGTGSPIDLTFPSLPHGDVVRNSITSYTVTATQVGTSVFQPGVDPTDTVNASDAPRQIAMGLVGVLIVTPTDCADTTNNACAFDKATSYADEAVVATTTLDAEFAAKPLVTGAGAFDMSYFGQSRDSNDQPRKVYHLIDGHAFPDTQVIDAKAGDALLLRYVNASVTDKSLGLLGLREVLLGRNADAYKDPQTFIAPLIGPGETADVAVNIPADAAAGQKYSLVDQGRQMNHGDAAGFGGALTFIVVWKGAPVGPTVSGLAFQPTNNVVTGTATPSAAAFPVTMVEWSIDGFAHVAGSVTGAAVTTFTANVPVTGVTTVSVRATDSNNLVSAPVNLAINPGPPTLTGLAYDLTTGHVTGTAAPWDPLIPVTKAQWSTDNFTTVGGMLTASSISALDFNVGLTAPGTVSVRAIDANGKTVTADVPVAPAAPTATVAIDGVGNVTGTGTATAGLSIAAAEYFVGADPGVGAGLPLAVAPNTGAVTLAANPPVTFTAGTIVSLRVKDNFGQWSSVATVTA